MQRKRLWVLAGVLLLAGLAVYVLLTLPAFAYISSTTHTTFQDFNPGSFYLTGMSNEQGGEVMLMSIGLAGEWSTPVITGLMPVFGHASVEHNGYIYVIGGQTGVDQFGGAVLTRSVYFAQINTQTHTLEPFTRTTELPSWLYPDGVYKLAAVTVGDYLYVLGGDDAGQSPTDVVLYAAFNADGTLGWWNEATPLPAPRGRAAAVVLNDFIYLIGGQPETGDSVTDLIWYASPVITGDIADWYTTTARLPYPVFGPMAVTFDRFDDPDLLYVIGGYYMHDPDEYARVEVFFTEPSAATGDIQASSWISTFIMPTNIMAATAVEINGQLILIGGWENPPVPGIRDEARAALLDIESGQIITYQIGPEVVGWYDSPAIQPPPGRYFHTAVVGPDGYVYVLGGTDGYGGIPLDEDILNVGATTGIAGSAGYAPRGRYIGPPIDLGRNIKPLFFEWTSFLPTTDVQMRLYYRMRSMQGVWGAWSAGLPPASPTGMVTTTVPFTQTGLQFQYRVQMTTTKPLTYTPVLHSFKLQYDVVEPPQFFKEAQPASGEGVLQNQPITYTIFVTNANATSSINEAYFQDILPPGLVYQDLIEATSGVDVTYFPITRQLVCDIGLLLPGGAIQVSFWATVSPTATGELRNEVQFHSFEVDSTAYTYHYVSELVSPVLAKTAAPPSGDSVWGGRQISYTLTYSNPNIMTLDHVVITDRVPVNTTFVAGSCQPACTVNGSLVRWELPTLGPLTEGQVKFAAEVIETVISGTQIVNTGYMVGGISSVGARTPIVASNAVTHTAIDKIALLSKLASPPSGTRVSPGDKIFYTLIYTNSGDSTLQNVTINETLPPEVELVAGSCLPACQVGAGGRLTWTVATLIPDQMGQIEFVVDVSAGKDGTLINNTAQLDFGSGTVTSNETSHRLSIPYDLQISKDDGVRKAGAGDSLFYTLRYTNVVSSGAITLTNVVITDDLLTPDWVTFSAGGSPGWQVISPTRRVYAVGTLAPNQAGQLTLVAKVADSLPSETEYPTLSVINRATIGHNTLSGKDQNLYNNLSVDSDLIRGADLIVEDVSMPAQFYKDRELNIGITVLNDGLAAASSWQGISGKWLAVELYTKRAGFSPSGFPADPHDHAGGWWCPDYSASCSLDQIRNLSLINSASADGVILAVGQSSSVQITTMFTQTGVYDLFIMADVGFDWTPSDPDYGRVQEADDYYNNIIYLGRVNVYGHGGSGKIYMPIVARKF